MGIFVESFFSLPQWFLPLARDSRRDLEGGSEVPLLKWDELRVPTALGCPCLSQIAEYEAENSHT